ncbi:hypothetical protein EDB85DRAFT_2150024 [Lactarius pseudohatsudake]|nr:hypothetical protein EDB85DRAFT_2150024 [Lactarius pseudohatsudake]
MSRPVDPVRDLNNYLQGHSRGNLTTLLSWETTQQGPQQQVTHYATAKFQGQRIGYGNGLSKGGAKAVAAAQALQYLQQMYPN